MLDDFILPLIGQKSPDYTEFYRALAVLGCIFIVGVIATFIYTRMMVYIGQGVLKRVRDDMFEHMQTLPVRTKYKAKSYQSAALRTTSFILFSLWFFNLYQNDAHR